MAKNTVFTEEYISKCSFVSEKATLGGAPVMKGPDGYVFKLPEGCERFIGEKGDAKAVFERDADAKTVTVAKDGAVEKSPPVLDPALPIV